MKKSIITLQDIIDYVEKHNIPKTIRIGIGLCDSERGDFCRGITIDTPNESCKWDEDEYDWIRDETHGEHCYFSNGHPLETIDDECILMITDGFHYEY